MGSSVTKSQLISDMEDFMDENESKMDRELFLKFDNLMVKMDKEAKELEDNYNLAEEEATELTDRVAELEKEVEELNDRL